MVWFMASVDRLTHHDVHAAQLRPHLDGHAKNDTLDNAGLHESTKAGLGLLAFEAERIFNLLVLSEDFGVIQVTAAVKVSKNRESLLPAVL